MTVMKNDVYLNEFYSFSCDRNMNLIRWFLQAGQSILIRRYLIELAYINMP